LDATIHSFWENIVERFLDDHEVLRKHFGIHRLNLLGHSAASVTCQSKMVTSALSSPSQRHSTTPCPPDDQDASSDSFIGGDGQVQCISLGRFVLLGSKLREQSLPDGETSSGHSWSPHRADDEKPFPIF
jgi:hypothetical protein